MQASSNPLDPRAVLGAVKARPGNAGAHDGPEQMLQSKAGYIDARPLTANPTNLLATHGRTIHPSQAEKNSLRAYVSALHPISRHFLGPSARLKGAHSEVPEAGNLVRISSELGRKRRLGQPAALGQLRAIV
jgi:hypothetical protein